MVFRLKLWVKLVSINYWTKFDNNFSYSISFRYVVVLVSFVLGLVQLFKILSSYNPTNCQQFKMACVIIMQPIINSTF